MKHIRLIAASAVLVAGLSQAAIAKATCENSASTTCHRKTVHSRPLNLSRFTNDQTTARPKRHAARHRILRNHTGKSVAAKAPGPTPTAEQVAPKNEPATVTPKAIPTIAVSAKAEPNADHFAPSAPPQSPVAVANPPPEAARPGPDVAIVPADQVNDLDRAADAAAPAAKPQPASAESVAASVAKADAARLTDQPAPRPDNHSWFGRIFATVIGGALAAGAAIKMLVG